MHAALWHYVSPERLAHIASRIGKVLVLTGDQDNLMDPANSARIVEGMRSGAREVNVEFVTWEDTGHGIPSQWPEKTNALLEKVFIEGRKKSLTNA
jgi:pimeloyl-ACP methyl ester carboxylesterase